MSRLTFALEFIRPPGTPAGQPAVAANVNIVTANPSCGGGAPAPITEFETASLQATPTKQHPEGSFTETATITFGDPADNNVLNCSSIGLGCMGAYACPEAPYTGGTVMWKIDGGEGIFNGATGAITSNFLFNKDLNALIAYQVGVIYLS